MRRLPLLVHLASFLLMGFYSYAQKANGSIKGKILAADGSPAYVTVELKRLKKITLTDNNGNFRLQNLPSIQDTLIIRSSELNTYSRVVSLSSDRDINLGEIRLGFNIERLQDVEIKGRNTHSYKSDYSFLGTKIQSASIDIPQSISTITKEMIQDKMQFKLKDAGDEVPGVNQYSGYDDYAIRGFKAENARMVNGLRGYNTTFTSPMLVNVERIEVLKGPSAVLYGNCDPGGTINLVTKKPLTLNEGSINFSGGSWDHFRAQGDITGPLNKDKTLLYRFNAGYDNTHSFRDLFNAKSYQLAPSFSYVPNDRIQLNIDFSFSHVNSLIDRGQPGFQHDISLKSTPINLNVSQPGDYLHETDIASNFIFSYKINKHISFNSGYLNYITQQDVAEHGVHSYITADSVNLYYSTWNYHTITHSITNYLAFRFNTGKFSHELLAGYDYISSSVNLNQVYYEQADQFGAGSGIAGTFSLKHPLNISRPVNKYQPSAYDSDASNVDGSIYHTSGIYMQEQVSYNRWKLLFGLREAVYGTGDDDDTTDHSKENILLPRVGLVYEIAAGINAYGTYNRGFDPYEASTSTQVFNDPFKPVTSELGEVGIKANFFNNKLSAAIAVYQLTLRNVAVNANDITNPNLYIQQGENRSRGIETEVNGNLLPNLAVSMSYSYCVAKVLQSKIASQVGTLVENAPKNTSNSWIKYTFTKGMFKGFAIAAGHSQVSARNTLDTSITLPGYLLLNAGIRYTYKRISLAMNINNITNQIYWTGAYNNVSKWPGAPRNFMINLGFQF